MRAEQVKDLMEAYSQVHGPNVVDIAAEIWVSACIAEGIDFSQYTLDELTEGFIADMSSEDLSESLLSEILGMPGAQNLGASLRQGFGQARRAVGGAIGKAAGGVKDVAGAAAQGLAGQRTTSKNPLARGYNAVTRAASAPTRAVASFATGVLTGKPGATNPPAKPSAKPPAKPSAKPPGSGGSPIRPVPGNERAVAPSATPSAKPAVAAPKPTTPTAPAKPAGSAMDQWAKANPKLAAAKAERDRTRGTSATTNPLMKDMKSSMPAPKSPAPSTASTGFDLAKKGVNLAAGVDIFDLVKGHLLDEGYADSEEGAMVIMVNMSEEWRESILEAHGVELDEASYSTKAARAGEDIGKPGKMFGKIAKEAGERYGSEERGKKVAGAVLAKLRKEEVEEIDESSKTDDGTRARIAMYAGKKGISFEPGPRWDPSANRGKGANLSPKQVEKQRRKALRKEDLEAWVDELIAEGYDLSEYTWEEVAEIYIEELQLSEVLDTPEKATEYGKKALGSMLGATAKALITKDKKYVKTVEKRTKGVEAAKRKAEKKAKEEQNEEYVNEAQRARENPEDHDKEEKRKYEPVRGERTPMPPRGDKRREEFEKWYAKNVR